MIPPPPRSTLFPYTTLFRSVRHRLQVGVRVHRAASRPLPTGALFDRRVRVAAGGDRKSTRLNSSHLVISYAVFCLKKKKKKKNEDEIIEVEYTKNKALATAY